MKKINLLACRSVLSPALSDGKPEVELRLQTLQMLSGGLFLLSSVID